MKLFVQKQCPEASLPVRATPQSAGLDLAACLKEPVQIACGAIAKIPTGLSVAPETESVALLLFARSGLASKHGVTMVNGVGLVDADYRGEICVPLVNLGTEPFTVTHGMRVAQLVVTPIVTATCCEVTELPDSVRGTGGFGSTGLVACDTCDTCETAQDVATEMRKD